MLDLQLNFKRGNKCGSVVGGDRLGVGREGKELRRSQPERMDIKVAAGYSRVG